MKAEEKEALEKLSEMKGKFHSLASHELYPGKYKVESLYVDGYGDLLFTIRALVNLCAHILEREELTNLENDPCSMGEIEEVLKLAAKMMPIDEGDLLDVLKNLVDKRNENFPGSSSETGPDEVRESMITWNHLRTAS